GTLSGNPLAMAAGYEMLSMLSKNKTLYKTLEQRSQMLEAGIHENMKKLGVSWTFNRAGSMFTLFFTNTPVTNWDTAKTSDTSMFASYFKAMVHQGIYL